MLGAVPAPAELLEEGDVPVVARLECEGDALGVAERRRVEVRVVLVRRGCGEVDAALGAGGLDHGDAAEDVVVAVVVRGPDPVRIVGDVRDRGALDAAPDRDVGLAVLLGVLAEGGGLGPCGVVEVRALPTGWRGGAVGRCVLKKRMSVGPIRNVAGRSSRTQHFHDGSVETTVPPSVVTVPDAKDPVRRQAKEG